MCKAEEQILRPFTSRLTKKLLNVVLDLNGLLCVCDDVKYHIRERKLCSPDEVVPNAKHVTLEFNKVIPRPQVKTLLWEFNSIANILV